MESLINSLANLSNVPECKPAKECCDMIIGQIRAFQGRLDDQHDVALLLASFSERIVLSVNGIGCTEPELIIFHGYVNGQPARLIQNKNHLNFLLLSVPKEDPDSPKQTIGFKAD